jgi:hypothetical protein
LGKRYRTRAEAKNTNRKKIPHGLDNCISAIHKSLLTESRNAIFNGSGVVMQRAGDRAVSCASRRVVQPMLRSEFSAGLDFDSHPKFLPSAAARRRKRAKSFIKTY